MPNIKAPITGVPANSVVDIVLRYPLQQMSSQGLPAAEYLLRSTNAGQTYIDLATNAAPNVPAAGENDSYPTTPVEVEITVAGRTSTMYLLPVQINGVLDLTQPLTPVGWVAPASLTNLITSLADAGAAADAAATRAEDAADALSGIRAIVVTESTVTLTDTVPSQLEPTTYTSPGGTQLPAARVNIPLLGQAILLRAAAIGDALDQLRAINAAASDSVANTAALTGRAAGTYYIASTGERAVWTGSNIASLLPPALNVGTNLFPVPAGSTGAGTRYSVIPERAALRVGVYESGESDDQMGWFRTRVPADLNNVGIGSVSLGRENLVYGYLSGGIGHSNSTYGVASVAFGAGNATGNPDSPLNGDGYCAVVGGKNSWARGTKSAAFGENVVVHARAGFATGYYSQAGDEAGGDIGNQAHGFKARSDGTFAGSGGGAWGANIWARKGSFLFGSGLNESNPFVTRADALHQIGLVARGKPVVFGDLQADYVTVWNGYGTDKPLARHDMRIAAGETVDVLLEGGAPGVGRIRMRGLDNSGNAITLAALEFSHENGGSPVGRFRIYTANGGALPALPQFAVNSDGSVEIQAGVQVGGSGLTVNGTRVVGGQLAARANTTGATLVALEAEVNALKAMLRAHGLIAP